MEFQDVAKQETCANKQIKMFAMESRHFVDQNRYDVLKQYTRDKSISDSQTQPGHNKSDLAKFCLFLGLYGFSTKQPCVCVSSGLVVKSSDRREWSR